MSIIELSRDAADRLLLLDRCDIVVEGDPVFNPATGQYSAPTETVATELACHFKAMAATTGVRANLGGETVGVHTYRLAVKWDAPHIPEEAKITCTSSADPQLVDRVFRVSAELTETHQMVRRLLVEDIITSTGVDDGEGDSGGSS